MKKQKPALTQPPVADQNDLPPQGENPEPTTRPEDLASDVLETRPTDTPPDAPEVDAAARVDALATADDSADDPARGPQGEDVSGGETPRDGAGPPGGGEPPGPVPPAQEPQRPSRLPLVVSVVALIAVGIIGWQMYELRLEAKEVRQELAQRLSAGDSNVAEARALTRQNQESIATLQGRFGALEAQVAETEGQAAALESLYEEFSRSRTDRVLAEVEHAINIAAQQVQLSGNLESALVALQSAEARLALPELGHLQSLRKALLNDIDQLKAHPRIDVSGIALRLENALERVDAMPLAYTVELPESAAMPPEDVPEAGAEDDTVERGLNYVRAFAADVWNEVRGMVRLERMDLAEPVLLSPEQSTYLRENVKLRLLTARLALLARDARTYREDLERAQDWIGRYFDTRDSRVQRVVDELAELAEIDIAVEPPTLVETFSALRTVQTRSPSGNASR